MAFPLICLGTTFVPHHQGSYQEGYKAGYQDAIYNNIDPHFQLAKTSGVVMLPPYYQGYTMGYEKGQKSGKRKKVQFSVKKTKKNNAPAKIPTHKYDPLVGPQTGTFKTKDQPTGNTAHTEYFKIKKIQNRPWLFQTNRPMPNSLQYQLQK